VTPPEIICHQFVELVTDYLDEALPAEDVELVEEHLVMCDWCRDYLDQVETTTEVVARAAPSAPPEELMRTVMDAFRERHPHGEP
jgi:predicted anti-sigma-YlaC factor YlaD